MVDNRRCAAHAKRSFKQVAGNLQDVILMMMIDGGERRPQRRKMLVRTSVCTVNESVCLCVCVCVCLHRGSPVWVAMAAVDGA